MPINNMSSEYVTNPKDAAKAVLEQILRDNSVYYTAISCSSIGLQSNNLKIYYSDSFVEYIKQLKLRRSSAAASFLEDFAKLHNCAITYGYNGPSLGKKNGIVDIKSTNTQLLEDYSKFLTPAVIQKYLLNTFTLAPVKVVAHIPAGNRLIGTLDRTLCGNGHNAVILAVSNYNGKPTY